MYFKLTLIVHNRNHCAGTVVLVLPHSLRSDTRNREPAEFRLNGARDFIRQHLCRVEGLQLNYLDLRNPGEYQWFLMRPVSQIPEKKSPAGESTAGNYF